MSRKIKRSTRQYVIVSIISVIVIIIAFSIAFVLGVYQIKNFYEEKQNDINQHIKEAYVVTKEIQAGEVISLENMSYEQIYSSVPQDAFVTKKEIGSIALVTIPEKSHVLKAMVIEDMVENSLREQEFSVFQLNRNLKENNFVDIRIVYPNGENYIVLSKKAIKNLSLENNNCFLWLTEEEILTVSSAIVDAYLHNGTKLYTTKYIEPQIQEASIQTYQPNEAVISLIKTDPNVVQRASDYLSKSLRRKLEERLDASKENEINWDSQLVEENQFTEDVSTEEVEIEQKNEEDEIEYVE